PRVVVVAPVGAVVVVVADAARAPPQSGSTLTKSFRGMRSVSPEPSAFIVQMWRCPGTWCWKTILVPSGEKAGFLSSELVACPSRIRCCAEPSAFMTAMSLPVLRLGLEAVLAPSGDQIGLSPPLAGHLVPAR